MEKQVAPNSYLLRTRSSLPQPQLQSGVTIWTDCNIMSSQQHLRLGLVSGVVCVRSSIMLQRVWFTNSSLISHLIHIRIEATMFRFRKSQETKLEGVTETTPTLLVRASSVSGSLLLVLPPFLDSYSEVLRATNALFEELQDHCWEWRIEDVEQWQLLQWQWCCFWWRWKMKGLKTEGWRRRWRNWDEKFQTKWRILLQKWSSCYVDSSLRDVILFWRVLAVVVLYGFIQYCDELEEKTAECSFNSTMCWRGLKIK